MAANQGFKSETEQNSEDGRTNSSYPLSPPSSNDSADKIYPCAASNCLQAFSSRGTLFLHVLKRHQNEKLLKCKNCDEKFSEVDQVREHQCGILPRPSSTGALLRSSSPDSDRASVPASIPSFTVLSKSPSPSIGGIGAPLTSEGNLLPQMLFSQFFNATPIPTSPSLPSKNAVLDLSSTAAPQPPFLSMPSIASPLFRAPFNFGLGNQQNPPRAAFMGHASTAASVLNNDDDWEALMEVTTTDEAEKIRALVGDKVMPTTDPNQCILCRRVLSCKSALQMHYRTHTGERPFKCKICQRAFTTKGNLKTHMGVHRAKHSFRGITASGVQQQCPICPKRFFTTQLLQNHMAQHTNDLSRNNLLAPFENSMGPFERRIGPEPTNIPNLGDSPNKNPVVSVGVSCSGAPSLIPSFPPPFPFFPLGLSQTLATSMTSTIANSPCSSQQAPLSANISNKIDTTPSKSQPISAHFNSIKFDVSEEKAENTNKEHIQFPLNLRCILNPSKNDNTFKINQKTNPQCTLQTNVSPINTTSITESLKNLGAPPEQLDPAKPAKGSVDLTTAGDRYNSYESAKADANLINHEPSSSNADEDSCDEAMSSEGTEKTDEDEKRSEANEEEKRSLLREANGAEKKQNFENISDPLVAMQKMWAETEPPPPRQAPVLSKHQCGVCFKHFSSSSALQIHMRTHTGDKPFKCEVCNRAFTTRGNLKVHMGTHMWQQNPSRRGRRIFDPLSTENSPSSELLSPLGLNIEASGHPSVETTLRPPFPDGLHGAPNAFPAFPFPFPIIPTSTAVPTSTSIDALSWMWRTVCSVCKTLCSSPQELEQHLASHLNAAATVNGSTPRPLMVLQKSE